MGEKKRFLTFTSDKGLIPRICKEFLIVRNTNQNQNEITCYQKKKKGK